MFVEVHHNVRIMFWAPSLVHMSASKMISTSCNLQSTAMDSQVDTNPCFFSFKIAFSVRPTGSQKRAANQAFETNDLKAFVELLSSQQAGATEGEDEKAKT